MDQQQNLFVLLTGWLFSGALAYIVWFKPQQYDALMNFVENFYHKFLPPVKLSSRRGAKLWISRVIVSLAFLFATMGLIAILLTNIL